MNMKKYKSLESRIRHILKAYGLSNRALGQVAGISGQAIGDILEGKQKTLKYDYLKEMSEKLDISLQWLLEGIGELPQPTWDANDPPIILRRSAKELKEESQQEDPTLSYDYLLRENITLLRQLNDKEKKESGELDKIIELQKQISELTEFLKKKLG